MYGKHIFLNNRLNYKYNRDKQKLQVYIDFYYVLIIILFNNNASIETIFCKTVANQQQSDFTIKGVRIDLTTLRSKLSTCSIQNMVSYYFYLYMYHVYILVYFISYNYENPACAPTVHQKKPIISI